MRLAILAALLLAAAAVPSQAADCTWSVIPNISQPDKQNGVDHGSSYPSHWSWQYVVYADHLHIFGNMTANAYRCTVDLSAAGSGNGTYTITRILACPRPVEDIEGTARTEFKARAELNDDTFARACGSKRFSASKMALDCHAHGGVEVTAAGHGDSDTGSLTIPIFPNGPKTTIYWSKGGVVERVFQDNDSGTGGRSPETITCQTALDLTVSAGWYDDMAAADINGSKTEVKVWGTCDGTCRVVTLVLNVSEGY